MKKLLGWTIVSMPAGGGLAAMLLSIGIKGTAFVLGGTAAILAFLVLGILLISGDL
jgi:hypothetical protein